MLEFRNVKWKVFERYLHIRSFPTKGACEKCEEKKFTLLLRHYSM